MKGTPRLKGIAFMQQLLVFHMQQMTDGPREGVLAHRVRCEELTRQINQSKAEIDKA
jgi:hypothetical protein